MSNTFVNDNDEWLVVQINNQIQGSICQSIYQKYVDKYLHDNVQQLFLQKGQN